MQAVAISNWLSETLAKQLYLASPWHSKKTSQKEEKWVVTKSNPICKKKTKIKQSTEVGFGSNLTSCKTNLKHNREVKS